MLYLLEKVLIFLPEALSQRWQYHRSYYLFPGHITDEIYLQYWSVDEQAAAPGEQLEAAEARGDAPLPPLVRCTWRTGWRSGHNVLKIILEANISKQVHEIFLKLISQTGACNICNPGARLPLSLPQHGAHCSGSSYAWARYIMRKKNYCLFVVEMPDMLSDVLVFWVLWNKLIISARDASSSENW